MVDTKNQRTLEPYEVFERANNMTADEQVALFKKNSYPAVQQAAQLAFGDFQFLVPPGDPPMFTKSNEESYPSSLHKRYTEVPCVVRGAGYDNMPALKRETMFVGILESVHPSDADLLLALVARKFQEKYPGVSRNALATAFPGVVRPDGTGLESKAVMTVNAVDAAETVQTTKDLDKGAEADYSLLSQDEFDELRRAVMRENHRRKQEKK